MSFSTTSTCAPAARTPVQPSHYTKLYELYAAHDYRDIEKALVTRYMAERELLVSRFPVLAAYLDHSECSPALMHAVGALPLSSLQDLEKYFELLIAPSERSANGAFFTPDWLVADMVARVAPTPAARALDPSCGCGAFLLGLVKYFQAATTKTVRQVVQDNIYGADIEERNVARSKLILALHAAEHGEALVPEDFNLLCADSLLADWGDLFPGVQFDLVVGNPPYISSEQGEFQKNEHAYRSRFSCVYKIYDTFALFTELGLSLLAPGGKLSFVLPTTLFVNDSFEHIRKLMLGYNLSYVADLGEGIFADATVPVGVFVLERAAQGPVTVECEASVQVIERSNLLGEKYTFRLGIDYAFQETLTAFESGCALTIGDVLNIKEAVKTGADKTFISAKATENSKPLAKGRHVQRFKLTGHAFIDYSKGAVKKAVPVEVLESPKLLIRRVADSLICAYDTSGVHAVHTLYYGKLKLPYTAKPWLYEAIELLLNSTCYTKIYQTKFPFKGKLFPEIRITKLNGLPLPSIVSMEGAWPQMAELRRRLCDGQDCYAELDALVIKLLGGAK